MKTHLALLPALLLFTCCAPEPDSTGHLFQTFRENGIRVAETKGGPKYDGEIFRYSHVVSLQQDESIPESLFYRTSGYLMDEAGYFYVSDTGNMRITVFNPEGVYSHGFGRSGSGPGEFQSVRILMVEDDVVACFDSRLDRTSLFTTEGRFLRTLSIPLAPRSAISELYPGPSGWMVVLTSLSGPVLNEARIRRQRVTVFSPEGDTLATVDTPPVVSGYTFWLPEYGSGATTTNYFGGRPQARYVPDRGILIGTGVEPELQWYSLDGALTKTIRLDLEREQVTREEHDRVIMGLNENIENAPNERSRAMARALKEYSTIPEYKDYWSYSHVDEFGYIWLMYPIDPYGRQTAGGLEIRVLNPEGEYLGDTTWPTMGGYVSRGYFLASIIDEETGEITLIAYRIEPAVDGLEFP